LSKLNNNFGGIFHFLGRNAPNRLTIKHLQDKFSQTESAPVNIKVTVWQAMASQDRKSHCDSEAMSQAVSNDINKTSFPGHRSFKEFSYAHNAPVSI